jgi:hypothetical protein
MQGCAAISAAAQGIAGRFRDKPKRLDSPRLAQIATARKVWESLGHEIPPIDCASACRQFDCLHCLANLLRRS